MDAGNDFVDTHTLSTHEATAGAVDQRATILQYATPTDLKQLESFVGKLREVSACIFIRVRPIKPVAMQGHSMEVSAECAAAFDQLKKMLADKTRLVHFDPENPDVLATDASPYDIGASSHTCCLMVVKNR